MAAGAFQMYENGLLNICKNNIDFETATVKAALMTNTHTPSVTTDAAWSDISADEISSVTYTDYAQQTVGVTSLAIVSNLVVFDSNNVSFGTAVTITARYLVIYKYDATPSIAYLIGYVDLNSGGGTAVSSTNGKFEIDWNAAGIYRLTPNV